MIDEQGVRLVCFTLCGELFAFDMEYLIEIVQARPSEIHYCITPVPLVRGTWYYRDAPVYVLDFRELFHLEEPPPPVSSFAALSPIHNDTFSHPQEQRTHYAKDPQKNSARSMLLVRIRGQLFALLSDTILQVVPLRVFYEYPDFISTLPRRYFAGITRVHERLVIILAVDELLWDYEIESLVSAECPLPRA